MVGGALMSGRKTTNQKNQGKKQQMTANYFNFISRAI